jgi:hypothetical protein
MVSFLDSLHAPKRASVLMLNGYRGQNAVNGELGMGEDKPKSATKPVQVETLLDLDIFQYVLRFQAFVRRELAFNDTE